VTAAARPELTERQRRILWHRSQGLSARKVAAAEHLATGTVSWHESVIRTRLGARDMTHAVHLATLLGVIGQYLDCIDRASYLRHLRRGEAPCPACKAANARHGVEQRAGRLTAKEAA
jgi:DNA-binding CsgD family transcriptional regulator